MYSLSYSSIADILAIADEAGKGEVQDQLVKLAQDLEQTGIGYFEGKEYVYRDSPYGMEVVATEDLASEEDSYPRSGAGNHKSPF